MQWFLLLSQVNLLKVEIFKYIYRIDLILRDPRFFDFKNAYKLERSSWWLCELSKKITLLQPIASLILHCTSTSTSIERMFSVIKDIKKRRINLNSENLLNHSLIKQNMHYLNQLYT